MIDKATITILDKSEQLLGDGEVVSFELDTADGKTIPFRINVVSKEATLADIVPAARAISTKLAIAAQDAMKENGQTVSCCKGCSACCNYLIPLSIPEVFRLREELQALPDDESDRILQACLDTAKRILGKSSDRTGANGQVEEISKWYADLKLSCPFISDDLCRRYEQRPFACREHIVTESNFYCQPDRGGEPNVAAMPVSVLEAVSRLTAELEGLEAEAVILPLALPWAEDNLWRGEQKWPAVAMVKRFVEILKEMAVENAAKAGVLG